ncbi:peptidoglycan DD-metalloendopeptidase family protein [Adhaeribacter sp. BT258]|uniref:Peptidoglycan DD-metalloendopeptidase family protein n=1 Tax=Adhaeribacter terrigena TaxID=2793070 RepID=A0ABS1BWS6_9BACT|nr:peptidoglycan DD-metalloendopeptidase family protein [Adhaeribacter terrigena]MBK0401591.1 peptidoglycan DD-metalloendopeptidase family protein [Adhaeribacter terrigena]
MRRYFIYFLSCLLLVATLTTTAQRKPKSRATLEREKRENLRRIQEANRILEQTRVQKEASLGELNAIKEKITVQKGVIRNVSSELHYIEKDVKKTEHLVTSMQSDLEKLKAEYALMIYSAAKTTNSYNRLMFLFASESFNQFTMRLRYLRQYADARKAQVAQINRVTKNLNQELNTLTEQQQEKQKALEKQLAEKRSLLNLKGQQDQVVQKLSKQEEELRREVARRQQSVRKLDNLIADMVREEIARAARAAKAKSAADARAGKTSSAETKVETNKVSMTPEMAMLSSSFAGNRGRLLWPVGKGFISHRFGKHAHPVLKGVVIENRGIDIQTSHGEAARSVFDGKVLTVASVPGMNNIVMIQHGDYFTVFAKLKTVSVSEGQTVSRKDVIGTVYTNAEGTTELQFQIWKNSSNLNPESWLAPQ